MVKKFSAIILLSCFSIAAFFAQNAVSARPWEEVVYRTESGIIPDTDRSYMVEIRFSPYGNEAYITYIILESLYREADAVYAVRDVARRFTAEYGYDWYNYTSEPVLRFDNVKHLALYRANVVFRKYQIQKEN